MSNNPLYTEYHPRWYRPRVSTWWWLQRSVYLVFVLREISSVFVAWGVVFILLQIHALRQMKESAAVYTELVDWTKDPLILAINAISLFFVMFHAITWFNLAPRAAVVHFRGQRVPGVWLLWGNYIAWALVSVVVAWIIIHG
jgi:fumarate reductase subunit C